MLIIILSCFAICFLVERISPGWKLPQVPTWTIRVLSVNFAQLLIVVIAGYSWEKWLSDYSLFKLSGHIPNWLGGIAAYFIATFIFYWWHRWRRDNDFLWTHFHQIHHSAQRIEVITSFYKHPLEMTVNSVIGSLLVYTLLGLSPEAGAIYTLCTALDEFFIIPTLKHLNGSVIFFKGPKCTGYIMNMKSIQIITAILFGGICYLVPIAILRNLMRHAALIWIRSSNLQTCLSLKMYTRAIN